MGHVNWQKTLNIESVTLKGITDDKYLKVKAPMIPAKHVK